MQVENIDEEVTIKNRILLREITIKRLTNKYLELISKLNTLTRGEIANSVKEVLNELDTIEISILKAENLKKLKDIDSSYQKNLSLELGMLLIILATNVEKTSKDIEICEEKLIDAKNEKEYKIHCEEIAKIINSYNSKNILEE
jgi:hypothetical protein